MKRLLPYIATIPLVLMALTPPWNLKLDCTINGLWYLWATFIAGFLSFFYLYTKTSNWLKLLIIWGFISCFISKAPYMSFVMFWSVIACVYYYLLCRSLTDWSVVNKAIQSIFFVVSLLIILQSFGLDTLCNFNQKTPITLGTIGNKMMLSSFVCILGAFLIKKPLYWLPLGLIAVISGSAGAVLSVSCAFGVWLWFKARKLAYVAIIAVLLFSGYFAYTHNDLTVFNGPGRLPVWKRTVEKIIEHPQGYGIGTYKILFPLMSQDLPSTRGANDEGWKYENTQGKGLAWRRAHNSWLQFPFELGIPGFILLMGFIFSIVKNVLNDKNYTKFAGLILIGVNMLTAFPDRFAPSVLIMIAYLAYCGGTNAEKDTDSTYTYCTD